MNTPAFFPVLVLALAAFSLPPAARAAEAESCEFPFRILQWNADGIHNDAFPSGLPVVPGSDDPMGALAVATVIWDHVMDEDANVVTLQEVTGMTLMMLETLLPSSWECRSEMFGIDFIAVCVDGEPTNVSFTSLTADPQKPDPDPPDHPWWGYLQVEYHDVPITSLHTRSFWRRHHLSELHLGVQRGIVSGDFNHTEPEVDPNPVWEGREQLPDWHQTDLDREFTWEGDPDGEGPNPFQQIKIDHVLTVEQPLHFDGDAVGKNGSVHRMVYGEVQFPPTPPVISAEITNAAQPLEVDGSCTADVEFQVTIQDNCCLDPDDLGLVVTAENPTANLTVGDVTIESVVPLGRREIEVTGRVAVSAVQSCPAEVVIDATAQDCAGNAADTVSQGSSAAISVIDTLSPVVVASDADLQCLWPPNHDYVCFDAGQVGPVVTDNCAASPAWAFTACTSDQPDDGAGDGSTTNDCVLSPDPQGFCARAERAGGISAGRRYLLNVEAVDACGNASAFTDIGNVHVPHNARSAGMCIAPP
ncbi:MAG: hypothetical protein ACRD3V_01545 [Vicinamibacteria bacterium]